MKCPACDRALTEKQIGSVSVRVCQGGCGGIWFDNFEVEQVDQDTEAVSELLLHVQRDDAIVVDYQRPRHCPRCETVRLKRVLLSPGSQVQIDECPGCDGCWLDERELVKLHDERVDMIESGRIQKSGKFDLISYLYEVRTGRGR